MGACRIPGCPSSHLKNRHAPKDLKRKIWRMPVTSNFAVMGKWISFLRNNGITLSSMKDIRLCELHWPASVIANCGGKRPSVAPSLWSRNDEEHSQNEPESEGDSGCELEKENASDQLQEEDSGRATNLHKIANVSPTLCPPTISSTSVALNECSEGMEEIAVTTTQDGFGDRQACRLTLSDVRGWSADEVYDYLVKCDPSLLPHAEGLHFQEVDGNTLLLLSFDVLANNFEMKVGPSVKILYWVKQLQESLVEN